MGATIPRHTRHREKSDRYRISVTRYCHRCNIGNTIRLDIENRREEIEVTKLIGASNAFVRRPFLWTGFWYGLLGGTSALLLVQYGLYLLKEPVTRLAGLYQGNITVATLGVSESLTIIGAAVFLGLFASWVTAARHMRRIEPR